MAAPAAAATLQQALTNMGNEAHVAAGAVGAFSAAGSPLAAQVAAAVTAAMAPFTASSSAMQTQMNNMQGQMINMQGQMNNMQGQVNAMQGQMNAMQGQMNAMQGQVNNLVGHVIASRSMAARAWNATCGDGVTRPYMPVPNDGGVTAPPGRQALRSIVELLALNGPQLTAWCNLYGVAPAAAVQARRAQLATALGVTLHAHA